MSLMISLWNKSENHVDLDVVDEQLVRDEYVCPYHGFLSEEEADPAGTDR
jgi:hypothetical protein